MNTHFKKTTDIQYEFKISRRTEPKEVRNLWDLDVKGPTDADFVRVCDADSLSTCIAKMGFVFEQDGL